MATMGWRLIAASTAFFLMSALPADAGALRIGGTGGALGGMNLLAEAFSKRHPEIDVEIIHGLGSSGGIKALLAGAVHVGVGSRALRDKERAAGAIARDYAKTPFILATRADNQVDNVTLDELAKIYRGDMTTWSDGSPIRLVLRPKADSDTVIVAGLSKGLTAAVETAHERDGLKIAATDQDAADALEVLPGGLCTSTLALIRAESRAIKPLALDGVAPTFANVLSGAYRLTKTFSIVTGQTLTPEAASFIDFVWSPEGQRILIESGHMNLPGKLDS
ncbi:MAG: substrate-binding domain-containing protein [Alphaproteobacteria bacterium]|nr:substrate-binding domain-containing protein [Alphaproteobacteria bacterium]